MSRGLARPIRHNAPKAEFSITSNSQNLRHPGIDPTACIAAAEEAPAADAPPAPDAPPAAEAAPAGENRVFPLTRALRPSGNPQNSTCPFAAPHASTTSTTPSTRP